MVYCGAKSSRISGTPKSGRGMSPPSFTSSELAQLGGHLSSSVTKAGGLAGRLKYSKVRKTHGTEMGI